MTLPVYGQIKQQIDEGSRQKAKQIMNDAMSMAGNYLQSMKQMAGGTEGTPMRTMQKEQQDIDNSLNKVSAYSSLSGKVPEMDYLKMVGLQNTFGPIAGQPTYDAQMTAYQLANSGSSGGGGGGSSDFSQYGLPETEKERASLATSQLVNLASSNYESLKAEGYEYPLYYTINSLLNDPEWKQMATASGADISSVVNYIVGAYAKDKDGNRVSVDDYFSSPSGSKLKGSYLNSYVNSYDNVSNLLE